MRCCSFCEQNLVVSIERLRVQKLVRRFFSKMITRALLMALLVIILLVRPPLVLVL